MNNFNIQLQLVGPAMGITPAEITAFGLDNDNFQFLADAAVQIDAYTEAVRQYRKVYTEGDVGAPTPDFPPDITLTLPGVRPTGLFERLDGIVKRIRTAPLYTPETGAALGIIPSKGDDIIESEMKPTLKASAMPGNVVEVSFTRGKSDGIDIETIIDGTGGWTSSGRFFKSPAALNIPSGTALPRAVQIRARYVIGNQSVGLNSDTVNVVTTP
jgi:hypothetical protein